MVLPPIFFSFFLNLKKNEKNIDDIIVRQVKMVTYYLSGMYAEKFSELTGIEALKFDGRKHKYPYMDKRFIFLTEKRKVAAQHGFPYIDISFRTDEDIINEINHCMEESVYCNTQTLSLDNLDHIALEELNKNKCLVKRVTSCYYHPSVVSYSARAECENDLPNSIYGVTFNYWEESGKYSEVFVKFDK